MIKKGTKNQIALNADFYKLALDDNNNAFIIQLDENDDASLIKKDKEKIIKPMNFKSMKNIMYQINKINSLKNELNQVNNLMHYIDEKLLLYENNNNLKNDSKKKINININKNSRKKKLFSVSNSEKNNNHQNIEKIYQDNINDVEQIIKKDETIDKVNEIISNNNKEKKEFFFKGEENSLFPSKEYFDIFQNKLKFGNKRKDSNLSDLIIEEKMNKFNYN